MFRIEGKHSQAPWLAPSDIVLSRNVKIQLFRPFWTNIWAFNVLGADFFVSLHWKPKPHFWSLPLVMFSLCPIMINFCLRVIEVQSLNSFLWQISTFRKEKREDSSLKYVVHVTCFEVFEIIWKLDYLMFLKYFEEKLNFLTFWEILYGRDYIGWGRVVSAGSCELFAKTFFAKSRCVAKQGIISFVWLPQPHILQISKSQARLRLPTIAMNMWLKIAERWVGESDFASASIKFPFGWLT